MKIVKITPMLVLMMQIYHKTTKRSRKNTREKTISLISLTISKLILTPSGSLTRKSTH